VQILGLFLCMVFLIGLLYHYNFCFHNFYLIFPICDKKDFEIFLISSMIVIFALTLLSNRQLQEIVFRLSRNSTRQLTSNILCPPSSQIRLMPVDDWREFWQIPSHLTWKISEAAAQNSSANQANPDCCCRVHCKCLQMNYIY
jgi:hypothetical protein